MNIKTFFIAGIFMLLISATSSTTDTYNMPVDAATGKITYKEVVEEKGTPQELFDRAYAWARKYFVNISSSVRTRDREKGILAGTTRFKVTTVDKKGRKQDAGVIMYDYKIQMRENRYRIIETNFRQGNNSGNEVERWFKDTNPKAIPLHKQIFEQIDKKAKDMITSIKAGMKPAVETSDDW